MPPKRPSTYPEKSPPLTAHRLAAWLSLARPISWAKVSCLRYPPSPDDIQVLRLAWQRRLIDLRENGLNDLKKKATFELAMQCQPHAIAYAGSGKPCRLRYCPFCSAQEAAFVYERVRGFISKNKGAGLILGIRKLRIDRGEMSDPFELMRDRDEPTTDTYVKNLIVAGGGLGTIVRFAYLPHPNAALDDKAILVARVLAAVPAEESQRIGEAGKRHKKGSEPVLGSRDAYAVPLKSVLMARAVARLCEYPPHIFTSPSADVCKMLNETASVRCSIIRGGFRSPLPDNPKTFTEEFVPKKRGFGIATEEFGGCFKTTEAIVAREFAAAFGLEPCDSFEELSKQTGMPMHWAGNTQPIEWHDLRRWGSQNILCKFLKASPFLKGNGPFSHRVVVCLVPTLGVCFIATCDGEILKVDKNSKPPQRSVFCFEFFFKKQHFRMFRITSLPSWQILLPRSPKPEPKGDGD